MHAEGTNTVLKHANIADHSADMQVYANFSLSPSTQKPSKEANDSDVAGQKRPFCSRQGLVLCPP